jgi:MFS family permease
MERSLMPIIAGVLEIISGVFGLFGGAIVAIVFAIFSAVTHQQGGYRPEDFLSPVMASVFVSMALSAAVLGIFALIGGICATRQRSWGWSLAGAIAATLCVLPLGVIALVIIVLSREQFEKGTA